jgi:uncharacterized protein YkwD
LLSPHAGKVYSRRWFTLFAVALSGCWRPPDRSRPEKAEVRDSSPEGIERQLLDAVNRVRVREGVPELQWHPGVAGAAEAHSRAMAERGFFSHTDPEKGDLAARMKQAGVRWSSVAENLFQQRGCPDGVQCAVQGWLESPGHRKNLLSPEYTGTGIGIISDERGTVYYTQIFMAR